VAPTEKDMNVFRAVIAVIVLGHAGVVFAQEWTDFESREDGFTCNFPGKPTVTTTTWKSEHGATLPARVYSAALGQSRYSMTVVDYTGVEQILTEKAKSCPAGAETCLGAGRLTGAGYWKIDLQGAPTYALWTLLQRDAKLTHLTWNQMSSVGGDLIQLTNADGSVTFASIYMHRNKLYIMEGTSPAGYPPPGLFQQSLSWIDAQGERPRYQRFYIHQVE
jgi:hypothetical protein